MAAKARSGVHPACPKCKSQASSRLRREGFMQRWILPYAGLYPWECGTCRMTFLALGRGHAKKHRAVDSLEPLTSQTDSRH